MESLQTYLQKEIAEELKSFPTAIEPEGLAPEEVSKEHLRMLEQKFGLIAPILTPSEKNLIAKEERRGK